MTVCLLLAVTASTASATTHAPKWTITSVASPTSLAPGGPEETYIITAKNTGDGSAEGGTVPINIADLLPAGIKVAGGEAKVIGVDQRTEAELTCDQTAVSCTFEGTVLPGDALLLTIPLEVAEGTPATLTNVATIEGGGAASATSNDPTAIGTTPAGFGFDPASVSFATASSQAGAHSDLTTTFSLNQSSPDHPAANIKNLNVGTPPGFIGNPTAVPSCTIDEVNTATCPQDAAVGVVRAGVEFGAGEIIPFSAYVYNVKPYADEPAALAFVLLGEIPVRLDFSVRSGGDYGLHASATGINDIKSVINVNLTVWGIPADHNGPGPFSFFEEEGGGREAFYGARGSGLRTAFLRNPTACPGTPLPVTITSESWEHPGLIATASSTLAPFTGCEHLMFDPTVTVAPQSSSQAGAPSSYDIDIHVPQNENPDGLATPDLRRAQVTLPAGTVISPSAANGLTGCSDEQFAIHSINEAACPHSSQVGTVQISTPLLTKPLEGQVYVGTPLCDPCGPADAQNNRMVRLFIQAQGSGVTVKVQGSTSINQSTGQLTTTFDENPQLPFEDLKLTLNSGPRAPLANGRTCGVTPGAVSQFTPYSSSTPATPTSPAFELTGCLGSQFAPSFTAGTTNNQAGAFSPETVTFSRTDSDQEFGAIRLNTPPGLLGMLSKVPLCGEADAQAGTCPAASQIGTTTVGAGPGSEPFYLTGNVYLTGPYKGGPFGLSVVVHALAGPYDLGNVIVRASIHVDPNTSALTISSDPFPLTLDGIPLQLRTVNVTVNRPGFVFNSTSCAPASITGTLSSAQGGAAALSTPYRAANCATLPFKPRLTVSTSGRTSKANGASLSVKVVQSPGEANIHKVDLQLPIALPSRLSTLQKACTEAQFAANPAGCPEGSNIGTARALTPVLNVPLAGPAYLVSHGGAAFPDVEFVLQGQGVQIVLDGKTDIKKGITYSRFETVPDAPISSFETSLPEGPHSVLAAVGNLCALTKTVTSSRHVKRRIHGHVKHITVKVKRTVAQPLQMPTTITGQNGAVLSQTTKVAVGGCATPHAKKARAKRSRVKSRKGR